MLNRFRLCFQVDREIFGDYSNPVPQRDDVIEQYITYMERMHEEEGVPYRHMMKHLHGMWVDTYGFKVWRRTMNDCTSRAKSTVERLRKGMVDMKKMVELGEKIRIERQAARDAARAAGTLPSTPAAQLGMCINGSVHWFCFADVLIRRPGG